jgi:DNA repair protein RadD
VQAVRDSYARGHRAPLLVSPTGSGKTVMFSRIARGVAAKGKRVTIGVHRIEIVDQISETLRRFGVAHGIIAQGYVEDYRHQVQVASIPTLARRLARVPDPHLVVCDEAHHCTPDSLWGSVLRHYARARRLGVTATPQRLDGQGLGDSFDDLVIGRDVAWLVENRFLSRYAMFAPQQRLDMGGIRSRGGDYAKGELEGRVDKPSITGDAIATYRRVCDGVPFLVRGVSVEHSQHIAATFREAGIACVHLDGKTPRAERREMVRDYRAGVLRGMSNVDLFSEGFDVPGVVAAIDLRPTESLTLAMQFWGRALRMAAGKDRAYLIDHVGNCFNHGTPDMERDWTLDGTDRAKAKEKDEDDVSIRVCRACGAVSLASASACRDCGTAFAVKARKIEEREGELEEVDQEALKATARAAQAQARTADELRALGMNDRRASHILEARAEKDRLRAALLDAYAARRYVTGDPSPSPWEIRQLKPKALRETIARVVAETRMAEAGRAGEDDPLAAMEETA